RKRAYCLKIQPATGSFARNLIYSTKPPKTVEKLNKAYKAIFTDIIDLSTPGRKSASASYLQ
ncbi:hypothetical protein RAF52_04265, partial [Klebsiella pneumoniae]